MNLICLVLRVSLPDDMPPSCSIETDTNLMRSTFTYVGVDEVNTSVRNVGSAARSPACCANISAPTLMSGHTTVSTATSPLRLKVRMLDPHPEPQLYKH